MFAMILSLSISAAVAHAQVPEAPTAKPATEVTAPVAPAPGPLPQTTAAPVPVVQPATPAPVDVKPTPPAPPAATPPPPTVIIVKPVAPPVAAPTVVPPPVEPAAPAPVPAAVPAAPVVEAPKRAYSSAVYLLSSQARSIKFNSVSATYAGRTETGNATFNAEPALGFGFEAGQSRINDWGWTVGAEYQFTRDVSSADATIGGQSASVTYGSSKVSFTLFTINAGAVYRWDSFYIPLGLNYSIPNVTNSTLTINGGLGAQLGVGYFFNPQFSLELLEKVQTITATGVVGGINIDYKTGYLAGLQLDVKFNF